VSECKLRLKRTYLTLSYSNFLGGLNYDIMKEVSSFPVCMENASGKFIWNVDDPTNGIDVPIWKQYEYDVDCGDDSQCDDICNRNYNALFINGKLGKKCYAYKVRNLHKYNITN